MVSVVIPAFQAEGTLERAIRSGISLAGGDGEVIVINDGSSDGTSAICQNATERYSNVIYIEQLNRGRSAARNVGLDVARGDWITFLDSDDWIFAGALRGVAISAAVLIHCLPQSPLSVAVRPLLNFAVALFIFLSGRLMTPERCGDVLGFYRRRVEKVLVPYLLWSLFYLLARRVTGPNRFDSVLLPNGRRFYFEDFPPFSARRYCRCKQKATRICRGLGRRVP